MDWSNSTKQYEVGVVSEGVMKYHVILLSTVGQDTCMERFMWSNYINYLWAVV
jgi:hypothetical protein